MPPAAVATRNPGGYLATNMNRSVPSQIKCNVCKKTKPSDTCFSNKQQDLLVAHMRRSPGFVPARDAYAVCTSCTSQQVVELECFYCDKTKALDKFPLAQRKKPDSAECWSCQQVRLGIEPDTESDDSGRSNPADDDDDDDEPYTLSSQDGGASLPTTDMDNLSLGGRTSYITPSATSSTTGGIAVGRGGTYATATSTGRNTSSFGSTAPLSSRGPISSASSVSSSAASSNRTITSGSRPAFNPGAYSKSGRRAPASEAGSTRSTPTSSGGGKFAKVKAEPRHVRYDVAEQEREQERNAAAAEDDEHDWVSKDSDSD